MQLVEHIGADMPSRFYIDGKRVSRDEYEATKGRAYSHGRLDCFLTKGKQLGGGKIRRVNYCSARF